MHVFIKPAAVIAVSLLPTTVLADFSGGYVGAGLSSTSGDITEIGDFLSFGDTDINLGIKEDIALTGFGGYQIQSGNIVYGGEIALSSATDGGIAGISVEGLDTLATDIKGRVGYVLNERVMAYGTAGFSRLDIELDPLGTDQDLQADGFIVGAGIDYLATDNIVLGAEFTNRQVEGSVETFGEDLDVELDVNSVTVRASFKF